jgi:hypothetical protein
MRNSASLSVLIFVACTLQGCVAWRYPSTPPITGKVLDAESGNPVVGAEVGFRKHQAIQTRTKVDGTFQLESDYSWGPAFILPFEFTSCGGVFYVIAPNYDPFEEDMGYQVCRPAQLADVKLRKKVK